MFCQFCGTAIAEGGSTCPKCGGLAGAPPAPVAGPANAFAPPPAGNWAPSPMPPPQGSSFPWVIIAVAGCFGLIVVVGVIAAIMVPALTVARKAVRVVDCRNDMKQVGVYLELYESKFRSYPDTLRDIYRPDIATDPNIFICPVTGQPFKPSAPAGIKWEAFASRVRIEYLKPPADDDISARNRDTSRLLMAWESAAHPDGLRTVLYVTGRVDSLDNAMFEAALRARREWK